MITIKFYPSIFLSEIEWQRLENDEKSEIMKPTPSEKCC